MKMNTLVVQLERKTDEEIERTPRRWIPKSETLGKIQTVLHMIEWEDTGNAGRQQEAKRSR